VESLSKKIHVGLLSSEKCDTSCVLGVEQTLGLYQTQDLIHKPISIVIHKLTDSTLSEYRTLKPINVLIIPGGQPFGLKTRITRKGLTNIQKFIKNGGGYIGICAGAVLVSSEYQMMGLVPVRCVNDKLWRDSGLYGEVFLDWKQPQQRSGPSMYYMYYENGPLFSIVPGKNIKELFIFGRYASDIVQERIQQIEQSEKDINSKVEWLCQSCLAINVVSEERCEFCEGSRKSFSLPAVGEMPGKIASCTFCVGNGKIVLFSSHPELRPYQPRLLGDAVLWAANVMNNENAFDLFDSEKSVDSE